MQGPPTPSPAGAFHDHADPAAFFTPLDRFNERWHELIDHPDWLFYGKDSRSTIGNLAVGVKPVFSVVGSGRGDWRRLQGSVEVRRGVA